MAEYTDATSLHSTDSATLALLGKKQVLKRRFGLASLVGFAVCELITWETVLALFTQPLDNGGPAATIYGFIIAWASSLSVYLCVAELASMLPIASGQMFWVYVLAPPRWKIISSYIIGYLTTLAWVATVATETLFAGLMLQGIIILNNPGYAEVETQWQGTLVTWAVIAACVFINLVVPAVLPGLALSSMTLHIVAFFGILITVLVMGSPKASSTYVWTASNNGGGWPTLGLSVCVGFLGNVATFVGADASVHMAEEVTNAARNLPRAIVAAMLINGAVGLAMMLTILYSLGIYTKLEDLLGSATGFPYIQLFADVTRSVPGATVMSVIVFYLTFICANGITTTASRMTWSFARDRGLPFSGFISRIDKRGKIPYIAVILVTVLAAALTAIYAGSEVAFNDVVSLTITGFYSSYFLPLAFLLNHRLRGRIMPYGTAAASTPSPPASLDDEKTTTELQVPAVQPTTIDIANAPLVWGPWHVPGIWGTINNIYACVYIIFVLFWSVWPPTAVVDYTTMNYSIVVTGGIMILATIWYFVWARRVYKGPTIDDEVAEVVRSASVASVH